MESSDLRVFRTVAIEGSVTKAAAKLGYVQSNVTARIRQLEQELGTPLFLRHNRGMTLSAGGQTLLGYADKIVGLLEEASQALASTLTPSGPLRLGSTQTAAAVRLPPLLADYYRRHPGVQLSVTTGHTQLLLEKILHYELDAAFLGCPVDHPDLLSIPVFDEELVILSPAEVSTLEEAVTRPILVLSLGCSYREILESWLQSNGSAQPVIMEFGTLEAIVGGVSAGLGISLLPRAVLRATGKENAMRAHEMPGTANRMHTTFVIRKDSFVSSALKAFMDMLPDPG